MIGYYDLHCLEKTRPYDGLEQVLPVLKRKGVKLAVISNKNHVQTIKVAEHFFGRGTFDFICGMSEARRAKPDPDMALAAVAALEVRPEEAILLGDSDIDILTALAAGIDAAGAGWGYRSIEVLRNAGAGRILSRPGEILGIL